MAKRSEARDTAKAEYIRQKGEGGNVNLKELAETVGVSYQTLRNWKAQDQWDKDLPKKKRGAQPGNRNSAGKKNAAGHHDGAPKGNKNAEKDGAYSKIYFDMLTEEEKQLAEKTPMGGRDALEHEMKILKVRENRILMKIAEYEDKPQDELFLSSVMDMRLPAGKGKAKKDGAVQQMGMYTKDSAFNRVMKLEEALYKVQGRIATIVNALKSLEETGQRMELEREKIEIMKMRATGVVDMPDFEETMETHETIYKQDSSSMAEHNGTESETAP